MAVSCVLLLPTHVLNVNLATDFLLALVLVSCMGVTWIMFTNKVTVNLYARDMYNKYLFYKAHDELHL